MILVIDLEATCSEGNEIPAVDMEIIEVGAVWAQDDGAIIDRFQAFVRPVLNPVLTPFCHQLTGITQTDVNQAASWPSVARELAGFALLNSHHSKTWGSWGKYDLKQIDRDCVRHGVCSPLSDWLHINLKREFAKSRKIKEVGMTKALELSKLSLGGSHHRGLDDAINIAQLLPHTFILKV